MKTTTARTALIALLLVLSLMPVTALAMDTILSNGRIFTANPKAPSAEAVAIRDGNILAVGSLADVERATGANPRRIDLEGGMLLPGLIDAHVHTAHGALGARLAYLPEQSTSIAELGRFARQSMDDKSGMLGDVLHLGVTSAGTWQAAELDQLFNAAPYDRVPVLLLGSDGHSGWANRVLLARAGISKAFVATLNETERTFYILADDGTPNGFIADAGLDKVQGVMPPMSPDSQQEDLAGAVREMNANGITAWLDPIVNVHPDDPIFDASPTKDQEGLLPLYKALADSGKLTGRVTGMVLLNVASQPQALEVYDSLVAKYPKSERLMLGGIKIFADGVLEFPSQTASLSRPYRNLGTSGPNLIGNERFKSLVIAADKRGAMVHIHAIGDKAVTDALDAIEAARKANGDSGIPHSLTHLQIVQPKDVVRFKPLGVIAVMQLLWAYHDDFTDDMLAQYLDPQFMQWLYPANSLAKAGATLASASDWPVSSLNPFLIMQVAMERRGEQGGVLLESERVSAQTMLYAYTINAAKALRRADRIGSIEPGKAADLVLVDRDLLAVPAREVGKTRVIWTLFDGKKVFEASGVTGQQSGNSSVSR